VGVPDFRIEGVFVMSFEYWRTRGPQVIRIALVVASIVGMVLGGSADDYWV
jgi:hypothetical protein